MDEFNTMDIHAGFDSFENDVYMHPLESLFDGVPALDASPCTATPAPSSTTHSSCSSSSSLEDDRGRLALEQGIHEMAWLGVNSSCGSKDTTFDIDTAIMVNPSSVLPSTLPSSTRSLLSSSSSCSSSSGMSPLLSSPSPLLSSSPVLHLSSGGGDAAAASYSTLSPSTIPPTVYIKADAVHGAVSSSTVQVRRETFLSAG